MSNISNIIKIKRGNSAPGQGTLKDGELGFDKEGENLYIGIEDDAGEPLYPINLTQGLYVGDEEVTEDATISIDADTVDGYHVQDIVAQARENMAQSVHVHEASDITSGVISVEKGGTGKNQHTVNSILVGNGEEAVTNIATASGALFATATNSAPKFGVLPYAQGGTGYALKDVPKYAIIRNAGDGGQYMWYIATGNGALFATAANGSPKFDTLPIAQGGTGATSAAKAREKLGTNMVLLWENTSPKSTFAAQTISISGEGYDCYCIVPHSSAKIDSVAFLPWVICYKGKDGRLIGLPNNKTAMRAFSVDSTGTSISFEKTTYSGSYGSTETENNYIIPMYIFGMYLTTL